MSTQSPFGTDASQFKGIAPVTPDRIDRYRIIRLLGEGGMGVVYLAEQDEPVRREVAIKVLRAGSDSALVVARFASERQALALMEHPNITRVFDAGLTATGLPYFVMERVEGVPINEYAAMHRLTTRARAALFVQVCRAVQHAHQKGIIHRDLKPSNVLVTETDGAPLCKVIDFGIAKATGAANIGARLTATGMAVGTPAYMSPEQFLGHDADVDTRTDIYSLGVLLYELLAGTLPGAVGDTPSWGALLRRAEGDLRSASAQFAALSPATRETYATERGTDPEGMRRSLRGDLDCILTKALELQRDRRYATAAAFADDLEHFLADEPISARGASRAYRVRKFAKRHRAGVVLSALLLLVLVATAVGASVQAQRLAVARTVAVSRQQQAEHLVAFMLGDLSTKLRPIGRLDVMEDVAQKALTYFAAIPTTTLSDDEVFQRADALFMLADLRIDQGRFDEADALMHQSISLMRPLALRDTDNVRFNLLLAHSEYGAGKVAWTQGHPEVASTHFVPFLALSERLVARYPDSLEYRAQRAYALNNMGSVMQGTGDLRGALRNFLAARAILLAILARDSTKDDWQKALGIAYNAAAVAQQKLGDLDASLASHRAELAQHTRLLALDTADVGRRRSVGIAHVYLSEVQLWRGDVHRALADLDTARGIYVALVRRDSANAGLRLQLANCDRRMAQANIEAGNMAAARQAIIRSRGELDVLLAGQTNVRASRELALLNEASARVMLREGRPQAAVPLARRAAAGQDSALVSRPRDIDWRGQAGGAHLVLGDALAQVGDSVGARHAWTRALALAELTEGADMQTDILALRATALLRLGRGADARTPARELLRRGVALPSLMTVLRAGELPRAG